MKRWDVCTAREVERDGNKKTYWVKVGAAFEKVRDGKQEIAIELDALPVSGRMRLFEPRERDDKSPAPF